MAGLDSMISTLENWLVNCLLSFPAKRPSVTTNRVLQGPHIDLSLQVGCQAAMCM
jgi:hypothetical protein